MRIALLIDSLATGGAENQCAISAIELAKAGHEVTLLAYHERNDYQEPLRSAGLACEPVATGRGFLRRIGPLAERLRKGQFDVLHCFKENSSLCGCVAGRLAKVPRVLAGCRSSMRESARMRWLGRRVTRRVDGWIVNSQGGRRMVIADYRESPQRVFLVRNAVYAQKYQSGLSPEQARASLGLPPSAEVVTMVANFRPEKNHPMFLRVARRLAPRRPDAIFLLAGHGPLEEAIRVSARQAGLADRVRFLGRCTRMADLLRATDVVLLTSGRQSEGLPNALIEAGAAGLPCVVTRSGAEEVVLDGRTGCLVEPDDDAAMADRVGQLLEDRPLREKLGQAAQAHVDGQYSPRATCLGLLAAYEGRHAP
jgi:glycosyltransferase involved in cell wall biosynthesis